MNAEPWALLVVAASSLNLACWGYFTIRVLHYRRKRLVVPTYLTAAAIVGTFAASAAGWVASINLLGVLPADIIRVLIWACWGGLFGAGAYAIVASIRMATAGRRRGRQQPPA